MWVHMGLIPEKKMEALYAELKKRAETASSSYSVQYIYSVHVTKNHQNN